MDYGSEYYGAAEFFGLPLLPPSKANRTDFKKGANMAIIGATTTKIH
jgi:hypothetical protein